MMAIAFKHSYTIGSLFGSRFYESLKVAIHYSYRAKDDVDNLRKALVIRLYEDQLEEFKQYDMDENDLDEYIPKFVDPILALSCGFKSVLTLNELQQLGRLKPKAIQERVEGVLSAEAIIGKIVFREGVSAEVQGFVETWIRERADKPEQLKAFYSLLRALLLYPFKQILSRFFLAMMDFYLLVIRVLMSLCFRMYLRNKSLMKIWQYFLQRPKKVLALLMNSYKNVGIPKASF